MLEMNIPGYRTLVLSFLVLDYNGTIACDGRLIPGVRDRLEALQRVWQSTSSRRTPSEVFRKK
jgi:soluble P-type ATPase